MAEIQPQKPVLRYQLTFEGPWPSAVAFLGDGRTALVSDYRYKRDDLGDSSKTG